MADVAKRNPLRCPTHPGALLREDAIPATTWHAERKEDVSKIPTLRTRAA
jgi:hypothetical protein